MKLTVGELKKLIADLPDETRIMYEAYHEGIGLGLSCYVTEDVWRFPKDLAKPQTVVVLNPGDDYDGRGKRADCAR